MELVGPRMGISSACALSRVVNVDPLSIHYLLFQPANKSYFLEVAKTFKALRHQLQCLSDLYTVQPMLPQPEYPFFKILKDGRTLTYEEKIQINVFRCVLSNTEDNTHINVIVKFVQGEYGADAHACMESKGYAPVVYYSEKITSLYNVIVMEYIENATSLREYVKSSSTVDVQSVKTKCTKILNELHEAGYCHGDL